MSVKRDAWWKLLYFSSPLSLSLSLSLIDAEFRESAKLIRSLTAVIFVKSAMHVCDRTGTFLWFGVRLISHIAQNAHSKEYTAFNLTGISRMAPQWRKTLCWGGWEIKKE